MVNHKPELYYDEKGHQKGYRVGISDGVYGTCPFCGKSYTKEDIKDSEYINFEHVYPSFAVRSAMNTEGKFGNLESNFMIAVHKQCNSDGKILEDNIKTLVKSINKGGQLKPDHVEKILQYCKKTSVLLRYLIDPEHVTVGLSSDVEKEKSIDCHLFIARCDYLPDTLLYENPNLFTVFIGGIGFYYLAQKDAAEELWDSLSKYYMFNPTMGIGIVSRNGTLYRSSQKIEEQNKDDIRYTYYNDGVYYFEPRQDVSYEVKTTEFKKPIQWKLQSVPLDKWLFRKPLGPLPDSTKLFDRDTGVNPLSRTRLAFNGTYRKNIDEGVVFNQNGELYIYQDGMKYKLEYAKRLKSYDLSRLGIKKLPDLSKHNVTGNFDCFMNELTSLQGAPKKVGGDFVCEYNKLTSLQGAPQKVGGAFECSYNRLTTLKGAPQQCGSFNCVNNQLTSLEYAPQECESFACFNNKLTTLKGAPQKVGYFSCYSNKLKSLDGAPKHIKGDFVCFDNPLVSLSGAPKNIDGRFHFDGDGLESLDGLPMAREYVLEDAFTRFWNAQEGKTYFPKIFDSADELRKYFELYKAQRKLRNEIYRMAFLESMNKFLSIDKDEIEKIIKDIGNDMSRR